MSFPQIAELRCANCPPPLYCPSASWHSPAQLPSEEALSDYMDSPTYHNFSHS